MTVLYGIVLGGLGLASAVMLGLVLYKEKNPSKAPVGSTHFSSPSEA